MSEKWNENGTVDETKPHFNVGYSSLSGNIYAGRTKTDSKGRMVWTAKRNITKHAIDSVFEFMKAEAEKREDGIFDLSIKGHGTLRFELDKEQEP